MGFLKKFFNWLQDFFNSIQTPIPASSLKDPPWLSWGRNEIGVHEIRGGENPRIIFYFDHCANKYKEDEVAWCAAFCNAALEEVGIKSTDSEAAMSFASNKNFIQLTKPIHGCIVVWAWSSGGHHVNFYDATSKLKFGCLGGNQADKNSGGMVSIRDYGDYVPQRVVGYYWPKEVLLNPTPVEPNPSNPDNPGPSPRGWLKEYDDYIEKNASPQLLNCSVKSIVGSEAGSQEEKLKVLKALFKAIATAESDLDPTNRYVEKTLGEDEVTKERNTSEGLFQVSYRDSMKSTYACEFDWEKDRILSRTSPNKTILNGIRNLDCAMKIFTKLLKTNNSFELSGRKYWSVLRRNGAEWKRFVSALKKEI